MSRSLSLTSLAQDHIHPSERLAALDTIRALALLGVIVMNTIAVTMVIAADRVMASASSFDMAIGLADFVLLQGKARACFALLFGIGFGLSLARLPDGSPRFPASYRRRLAALFVFGFANQAFLFWGDILAHYAVLGAALPLARGWHDRTLLWAGGGFIVLPPLAFGLATLMLGGPLPNLAGVPEQSAAYLRDSAAIYAQGSYAEVILRNLAFQPRAYLYDSFHRLEYDLSLLGLFLLGCLAARIALAEGLSDLRLKLRRIALWCLPVGAAISLVHLIKPLQLTSDPVLQAAAMAAFSGPSILALGLVAIAFLWLGQGSGAVARWLAPAGRMALTCYLAAGGIASWVTYGFGLDLLGRMNLTALTALGIAIYVGLVLFSHAWLRRFRVGPAEWLLRSITYGRWQRLRRDPPRAPGHPAVAPANS